MFAQVLEDQDIGGWMSHADESQEAPMVHTKHAHELHPDDSGSLNVPLPVTAHSPAPHHQSD